MTITYFKTWFKNAAINTAISIILALQLILCIVFIWYSVEHPVFFGISATHFIVMGFGSVLLFNYLQVPIDFLGTVVAIFFWVPCLALFHGSVYVILVLNVLEITRVVLDWKMWTLLAVGSLIITAVFGGGAAWLDWRHTLRQQSRSASKI